MTLACGARGFATALCGVLLAWAPGAVAAPCEALRPTDPGGTGGIAYDTADVSFYDAPGGRARIHYAASGRHAPPAASGLDAGVPDAVVIAAEAADAALSEFAALGFAEPRSDVATSCASNGGDGRVDVYLVDLAGSADGQAVASECDVSAESRRCMGFVLVENDFRGAGYANIEEAMRTVVPHELFHVLQDAYDGGMDRWWREGTAQWAAKQVYPELRDLERFLPALFAEPWRSLDLPASGVIASYLYATALWAVFLSERHGERIVVDIFEALAAEAGPVLKVSEGVLERAGSSLSEEYLWFAAYNAATGGRAGTGVGYANASSYPQVALTPFDAIRGARTSDVLSGLSAAYFEVRAEAPQHLELSASPERVTALLLPVEDGTVRLDQAERLPVTIQGDAIVVVAARTTDKTDAPFSLASGSVPAKPGSSGCSLGAPAPSSNVGILLLGAWLVFRRRLRAAHWIRPALFAFSLSSLGCSSEALDVDPPMNAGGAGGSVAPSACRGAVRQVLGLVDSVSMGEVIALSEGPAGSELFVNASRGGLGAESEPWVYLDLRQGQRIALTDLQALESPVWDLAVKRSALRTNSGDSGPGRGGARFVAAAWEAVTQEAASQLQLPSEDFMDDACEPTLDATGLAVTTFSGWSLYDTATHVLTPQDGLFVVAGGDGARYKLAILDYYAAPDGSSGGVAGRYKLRVARVE